MPADFDFADVADIALRSRSDRSHAIAGGLDWRPDSAIDYCEVPIAPFAANRHTVEPANSTPREIARQSHQTFSSPPAG